MDEEQKDYDACMAKEAQMKAELYAKEALMKAVLWPPWPPYCVLIRG